LIEGALDTARLQRAVIEITRRYEILRTTFRCPRELTVPVQVVEEGSRLDWRLLDLSHVTGETLKAEVESLMRDDRAEPGQVEEGPAVRFILGHVAADRHVLLVSASSLVADARSLDQIAREAARIYAVHDSSSERRGDESAESDEPLQYASFAAWQAEVLEGGDANLGRTYWRSQDLGSVLKLTHPLLRKSPNATVFCPERMQLSIGPELVTAVDDLAKRNGKADHVLYLACWRALAGRITGNMDVPVSYRVHGRTDDELETAIGPFASYVPLRCPAEEGSSFQEFWERISEAQARARDWEPYFSWEDALGESGKGDSAYLPFAFEYQGVPAGWEISGIRFSAISQFECADRFHLKLSCTRQGDALSAELHYDSNLLSPEVVLCLAQQYEAALRGVIPNPTAPFEEIDVVGREERLRLLDELNATQIEFPDVPVHGLFEAHVARCPDRCAVVYEDGCLTYRALDERANAIAAQLRSRGIGAGAAVGIRLERSLDMIVAIVGVLKAGGAYVPLDPSMPQKRLEVLLSESGARVVLTQGALSNALDGFGIDVIVLDRKPQSQEGGQRPRPAAVTPGDLAYVMFTSGTTGLPKGVAVEHRQVANYVRGLVERLRIGGGEHMAMVSTFAADLGNTVLYAAMCTGGTLHILSERRRSDPDAMAQYFARWPMDCLKIVPSHLEALLSASAPENVLSCRRLVLGGEATKYELLDRIETLSSGCDVFNHYGPTETTVGATTCPSVRGARNLHSGTLPIGRPLPNYRTYVLASVGTLQPIGVFGELYIGGSGVARGYLNRPDETADRFVPDPFGGSGQRLYRTGDRSRVLPDGTIEFRGRVDHQIKIRGYRVESAEVEAALAAHPAVREVVVVARNEGPSGSRLIAYVVVTPGSALSGRELLEFARERLPDYMVPAVVMPIPSMPLTRNGKIDRDALPHPDEADARRDKIAPRTEAESRLAAIWSELLGVEELGVRDDFFDLGGHSLSAMRLVARIRQSFDVELPLLSIFEARTIEGLAERISTAPGTASGGAVQTIVPGRRDPVIPASFSQERLWLFDQRHPGSSAYNIPHAVRITGALAVPAIEQTIEGVVDRHEVLRTNFDTADGRPVQVIAPPGSMRMAVVDLRGLPEGLREAQVAALVRLDALHPFDLSKGPVCRGTLVQLGFEEHAVLWNQHHISSDAWSAGVFARELSELFSSFVAGAPSVLAPLPIQYADFSQWQRRWLEGDGKAAHTAYWKARLESAPASLELSTDRPRPPVPSFRGGAQSVVLAPELSKALTLLGRQEGATMYMTLLAGLNALLYLHTAQTDIVVGSPTAGRSQGETEGLIGFFLNTLALRTTVKGDLSFRDLLKDVRAGVLGAFAHQDLPFERVVEELRVERDQSRPVLYQVMFNHQKAADTRLAFGDLRLTPMAAVEATSKFDLTLYALEGSEQMALRMAYNSDIFDGATVAALLGRFVVLLQGIVANPDRTVSSLPLLKEEERAPRYAPGLPIATAPAFVRFERADVESTIHERFEKQAGRYPEHIAVKTRRYEWTYKRLDDEATNVAARIQARVGDVDTRVGLLFESDAPLLAGILGSLKAGHTYVPLDPSNPRDRLAYMVKHSEATVLLADDANLPLARDLAGGSVEVVGVESASGGETTFQRGRRVTPDSIAYILYTSGSTGVPKGVVQSHRNVLHFMRVYTNNLGIHHDDRLSLLSSYGFDGAVMDIFGALMNGATLVPARLMDEGLDGVLKRIADERVTLFHSTPTVFRQLFGGRVSNGALGHVRAVVLGGEEALTTDLELFKRRFSKDAIFVNGLGPSESTVTLQHFMDHDTINTRTSLPVGLPVSDTEVLLLDARGTATEVYGEIAIRSPHVALGYWRDDEKTAAAFRTAPDDAGRRVYRTGDMGRRLPDGTLEFVGRKDSQVKIRGFRIELGEVESVLGGHPDVDECAVLARSDDHGSTRLIAYVRPSAPREDMTSELRAFLKQKLPDYMVPSAFVVQPSLPVTANGKLDRNALPDVEALPETDVEFIAPRTPAERKTAELWTELLGIKRIGVLDDFFSVGGHSLHAMRLISRIRSSFEIELPLRVLFESPTLAGMAAHIERALAKSAEHERKLSAIEPTDRDGDLPLSFAQQRMWILDQLEPGSSAYNVPMAVELEGPLHLTSLEHAIDVIVARHEVLRTTFHKSPRGEAQQIIHPPRNNKLPLVDLTSLPRVDDVVSGLARREAARAFDLASGPLLRVRVLQVADEKHVVLFTMHHVVSDAWSTGVLVRELSELYQAFVAGRVTSLQPLGIQYADYAVWQRRWLTGEMLQTQLSYWKQQLQGLPDYLNLPLDRPRASDVTHNGAKVASTLSARLVAPLAALARAEGTTLFVTLLATFQTLLHRYSGQDDIVVGTPVAGRTSAETEPLIGFFVNTLVLRSRVDPSATFREFLRTVHATVMDATAHQDLPFERLVDELQPTRGVGHTPLFQVAFVLQNAPREALAMSELTLRNWPIEAGTAKFDWSLSLVETGEEVAVHFEYNTDLFNAETIRRVIAHYETLLGAVAADPSRSIAALEMLSDAARHKQLVEWNDTAREYPREASIQALFEEQVERSPDAVAVIRGDTQLTYRTLNDRANRLARYIRTRGVGLESRVGICLERSPEFLVAVLAVLKSGAAYAPLDPTYPQERIELMADDAGIELVVTVASLAGQVPGRRTTVLLDEAWGEIARERGENLTTGAAADQLAYVLYTSGSTGRPKGIAVEHRAVIRLVRNTNYVDLGPRDVIAHASNTSFDATTFEIWGALLQGGALVVIPSETVMSPKAYSAELRRHRITALFVTTALFNRMVSDVPDCFSTLDAVLFGGEAVDAGAVRRLLAHEPPARLLHVYGPTENTTFSSWYPVIEVAESAPTVPIGRAIANTQLFVLNDDLRPVPIGVSGELYVGGDGLARAYLRRPDLTAERFVPDPYASEPGARLYRTGDVVKNDSNGNVVFVGRIDHQVKIRGFRIELGEIEAALVAHGGVRDAVVLAREDVPGDKRLAAYVVPEGARPPEPGDLRSYLLNSLPSYMVPTAYVMLDALPLTSNGKVDRRVLPPPDGAWAGQQRLWDQAADAPSAASTDAEIAIARIWQDVLGIDGISVDDKFFDLGGHSLNAIQVITRLERECGFEIEFNDLIFQTLRQIAAVCGKHSGEARHRG
jgi:amino acid adenylation domain-containing protein